MKRIRKNIINSKIAFAGTSALTGTIVFGIATSAAVTGLSGGAAIMGGLAAFGPGGAVLGLLWIGGIALFTGAVVSDKVDKFNNHEKWISEDDLIEILFEINESLNANNIHIIVKNASIKYNIDYQDLLELVQNNELEFDNY